MQARKLFVLTGIFAMFFLLALVGVVGAATNVHTYYVTSTIDEPDQLVGNGVCSSTPSHECTLRAAIMDANAYPGPDYIKFTIAGPFNLTRGGVDDNANGGDLDITEDLHITGQSSSSTIIDGKGNKRVFDILSGTNVTLEKMTLRNGAAHGGAIWFKGNQLILDYMVIDGNNSDSAIASEGGSLSMYHSIVQNNSITTPTGGPGGIYATSTLYIEQSLFYNNHGFYGGAIDAGNSTVIINSTFSGNYAGYVGGAISFGSNALPILLDLSNVTITGNHITTGDDLHGTGGAGVAFWSYQLVSNPDHVKVRNSIIAGNVDENFDNADDNTKGNDCVGNFISEGFNLIGDNLNCSGFTNNVNFDRVGTHASKLDPKLNALASNGGFSKTHSLKSDSPALDTGNFNGCKDRLAQLLTTDQRGFVRPWDGNNGGGASCDIGAFESASPGTPTPTPTVKSCDVKPDKPTATAPSNGAQVTQTHVQLKWNAVDCTDYYRVIVKQDSKTGIKVDKYKGDNTSFTTKKLPKGHTYYWLVKACNDVAGCGKKTVMGFSIKQ